MALDGTVKLPGMGTVKKKTAYGAAGAIVLVLVIYWFRQRKTAAAAPAAGNAGVFTDPAGNSCTAPNPATGYCPGTAEDQQALAAAGGLAPFDTSQLGSGGLGGYYYPPGGGTQAAPPGPGNFADNAEWAQYVETYMTGTLNADPATVGNAIGKYLTGQPLTADQVNIVQEAIAYGEKPPVSGADGDPPGFRTAAGGGGGGGATATVPRVVGQTAGSAHNAITAAGLKPTASPGQTPNMKVSRTAPDGGTQVPAGSAVAIFTSGYVTK
jgi:hypothetical protein